MAARSKDEGELLRLPRLRRVKEGPDEYPWEWGRALGMVAAESSARQLSKRALCVLLRRAGLRATERQVGTMLYELDLLKHVRETRAKDLAIAHRIHPVALWLKAA